MPDLYVHMHTQNSLYLVDVSNRRVKRVDSNHPPTRRQGLDGNWTDFVDANVVAGGVFFVWAYGPSDVADDWTTGHGTLTSIVQRTSGSSAALQAWQDLLDDNRQGKPT